MPNSITEASAKMTAGFPKSEPSPPNPFALGVAEELRDLAARIETGVLVITHFSLTAHTDSKQRLEIEVA